jgi:isocitrate dehydrogenase
MAVDRDKLNEFMCKAIGDIGAATSANSSHCGYVFSESHGMWTTEEPFANDRGEDNLNPAVACTFARPAA